MSKTEHILLELDELNPSELEIIYHEIAKRVNSRGRVTEILGKFIGKGKGVWDTDAQEFVNKLREDGNQ